MPKSLLHPVWEVQQLCFNSTAACQSSPSMCTASSLQACSNSPHQLLISYPTSPASYVRLRPVVAAPSTGQFGQARYPSVDLNTSSLKMYWNVTRMFGGQELWRELLRVLRNVADRHSDGTTVANVALAWVMQQGSGSTVLPIVGLRTAAHVADNQRALSLKLTEQDLAEIAEVLAKAKGPAGDIYSFERS